MGKILISQHIYLVDDAAMYLENTLTGAQVSLTVQQYKTLHLLTEKPGMKFTRRELARGIWGSKWIEDKEAQEPGYDVQSSVGARISKARAQLNEISPGLGRKIKTIKNINETYFTFESDVKAIQQASPPAQSDTTVVSPDTVKTMEYWQLLNLTVPGSDKKYDAAEIALALRKNDLKLYPGLLDSPELAGDYINTWGKHLSKRPESFKYLVAENNQIVGNFSFVALSRTQEDAVMAGALLEESFDISQTEPLSAAGIKDLLYILNFSVNDEYATPRNKNLLKQLFFKTMLAYAENDIYFRRIIINIFEPAQYAEFKQWGFVELNKRSNVHYGKLFALDMIPYPESLFKALSKNRILAEVNCKLKDIYDEI